MANQWPRNAPGWELLVPGLGARIGPILVRNYQCEEKSYLTVLAIWLKLQMCPTDKGSMVNATARAKYEARAKVFKALAHPTRLFIVDDLARRGPRCVCELTALVGVDISTVSRHLALLKNAGIVADEKRGAQVYYRLRVKCVVNFFECVEAVLASAVWERQEATARR